jgi:hypothetical protein
VSIFTDGAGVSALARRYLEWLSLPYADNQGAVWSRSAYIVDSGSAMTGSYGIPWNLLGGQAALVQRTVDEWPTILVRPAAAADCTYLFGPQGLTGAAIDFSENFPLVAGGVAPDGVPSPLATSVSAWIRKETAAAATSARQTFGWAALDVTSTSGNTPRAGLIGDGLLGFRFGSVNCPQVANPVENGIADIDANAVQPPELVNPGARWFHVRVKIIPASASGNGRWGAYLNGSLVASFATAVNFPRRAGSLAAPGYQRTHPFVGMWRNPNLDGFHVHDLRVVMEDNLVL